MAQGNIRDAVVDEWAELAHVHFPVRLPRDGVVGAHESYGGAVHVLLQESEHCAGHAVSALRLGDANRTVDVAIRERREGAQHGLDDADIRLRGERSAHDVADDFAVAPAYHERSFANR